MAIFDFLRRSHRRDASDTASTSSTTTTTTTTTVRGVDYVNSKELALRIATVYRCADILSKGIAQLPMVIRRNDGGYFREDPNDIFNLSYLLRWRPNERLSSFEFKRSMMLQLLFNGNALIVPERGPMGYTRMALCAPNTFSYDRVRNKYVVSDAINGVIGTYDADSVIHIKNLGTDGGTWGLSTLAFASRVLAISANADEEDVELFKTGGRMRGFVSGQGAQVGFGAMQDSQLEAVASNIETQLSSGMGIFALPGEMKFQQISLSPKDIELLSTKQFNVLEICRFFGVHPDKVFAGTSTNYKASEMSQVSFLTDTLQPYLTQIETEFQIKLIPKSLISNYLIDFDIEPLMQTDLATKADYLTKMLSNGGYTVNEVRKAIGKGPVKGGDVPRISANITALSEEKATQNEDKPVE